MTALVPYAAVAFLLLAGASRWVLRLRPVERLLLALAPFLIVGPALIGGRVLAPIDQYAHFRPSGEAPEEPDARPKYQQFDVFTKFIPWRIAAKEALVEGAPPTWNPHMQSGDPLLGASEPALLHPLVLVSLMLPWAAGWTFVEAGTLLLAILSGHLLLRALGAGRTLAYLAGTGWMLSAYGVFWLQYPVSLTTAHLPLTVLALLRLARGGSRPAFGLAAATVTLHLLGGHPESALYSLTAACLLGLCGLRRPSARRLPAYLLRAAGAVLVGVLLASAAILPTLDTVFQSEEHAFRSAVYAREKRSVPWGTAARRWAPNVVPAYYGTPGIEERADKPEFLPPASSYCGSVCLILALGALGGRRLRPIRLGAAALAVAGTLAASKAPGLVDALAWLPLFDVSIPEYLTAWGTLGVVVLAGLSGDLFARRRRAIALASVGLLGLLLASAFAYPRMRTNGLSARFTMETTAALAVPGALLLVWLALPVRRRAKAAGAVLLLVSQRWLEVRPSLALYEPERFDDYRAELATLLPDQAVARILGTGERLIPNVATLGGLDDPRGYTALTLAEYADTYPLWAQGSYPIRNRVESLDAPFLSFLNVRFAVVGEEDAVPSGWRTTRKLGSSKLLENGRALSRAFVPGSVETCGSRAALLERLAEEQDLGRVAFLEAEDANAGGTCTPEANATGEVEISRATNGLDLEATLDRSGWIVVSQAAWRGWTARTGSDRLPLARANGAFLAIRAPAGTSRIRLRFLPTSVVAGACISAATLLVLGLAKLRRPRA